MKAQTVSIRSTTWLSVLLVGAVIAFCSVNNARADSLPDTLHAQVIQV